MIAWRKKEKGTRFKNNVLLMYANEICQGTGIRIGQKRRSGAASKTWERAAAETGLQAEGIP